MSTWAKTLLRGVLLFAMLLTGRAAEDHAVQIGPTPAWVEATEVPELAPTPAADVSHGYDYLLLFRQVNVEQQATSYRTIYRITSASALQSGARLSWTYDPAYEQVTLHHIRVMRDGHTSERLVPEAIKTIQQERDLDRHMLNGNLTAFVLLEDIRVGDVIDYASTRQGWNPTFGGKYFDTVATSWSVPVRHQRFRLDAPAAREIFHQMHGNPPETALQVKRDGGRVSYVWDARDLRPFEPEGEQPGWFEEQAFFQFTELEHWSDVVTWAEPLYEVADPLAPALRTKAEELTRGLATDAEKTIALLQFVQEEVRYLGLELGAGSYRPNPPETVLSRRFGDCKDKTLLFCTLMRAAGLTAYPALLHSDRRGHVGEWLPTPHAFDHVIAFVPDANGGVWLDPTLTQQAGELMARALPDYRSALVLRAGEAALAKVDVPREARPTVRIEETFDIPAFDQPARFTVVTRFTGTSADSIRRYFTSTTPEQITKDYVNYYASAYPGLTGAKPIAWTEDRRRNVVTATEAYDVPELWKKQDDGALKAEFYPKNMSDYAVRPQRPVRTTPLAVAQPVDVMLATTLHLPEEWSVKDAESTTDDPAFHARTAIEGRGKVVTMRYTWQSRDDHVEPERMPEYMKALNAFRESLGYTLTYRKPAKTEKGGGETAPARPYRTNWLLVLAMVLTVGASIAGAVWVWRWQPKTPPPVPTSEEARLCGLGGWLVLVGFGVVVRPIGLFISLVPSFRPAFNLDVWENMTLPGGAAYQPALGPLIVTETVGNTLLIAISLLLAGLFFAKKRAFPVTFVVMATFMVVFLGLDSVAGATLIKGASGSSKELAQAIGQALVWIPYMLVSKRVRVTFVR